MLVSFTQVLEGVIKYRWNALPAEQRDGMKNFISDIIVQVLAVFG
jgi:exportin-1